MKFCSSKIISFNHYNHLKQGKALRYLFSSSRCSKNGIIFVCAILHFVCAMYASAQHVCAIRCAIGFFFRTPQPHLDITSGKPGSDLSDIHTLLRDY